MKTRFSALTRKQKVLFSLGTSAFMLAAAFLIGSSYSIYHPVPFNERALSRAAHWVQAHNNPPRFGAIALPPQFASVSATGKAYVSDGGLIFFPSWMGRKTLFPDPLDSERGNIEGYGFSIKPLPTEESEPDGSTNFFCMLDFSEPPHLAATGANGPQTAVSRCLKPHWYAINSFS